MIIKKCSKTKYNVKLSKSEWMSIGKQAGWYGNAFLPERSFMDKAIKIILLLKDYDKDIGRYFLMEKKYDANPNLKTRNEERLEDFEKELVPLFEDLFSDKYNPYYKHNINWFFLFIMKERLISPFNSFLRRAKLNISDEIISKFNNYLNSEEYYEGMKRQF